MEREQCSRAGLAGAGGSSLAQPLRDREREGPLTGRGLRPAGCRLAPAAAREREGRRWSRGGAWPPAPCAWRLRPDRRAEGGLCHRRRPSRGVAGLRWRVAASRCLGAGADARGGVRLARASRTGEAASGLGRTGERQGRTVSRNLLLDVGLGQFKQVEKKNFGPNPGPWPGWPGV